MGVIAVGVWVCAAATPDKSSEKNVSSRDVFFPKEGSPKAPPTFLVEGIGLCMEMVVVKKDKRVKSKLKPKYSG
jgi:hypothetical protein